MKERFSNPDLKILSSCVDIIQGNSSEENIKIVADFYSIDPDFLSAEVNIFHNIESASELKTSCKIIQYLESNSLSVTLPNFSELVKIFASIPATSCSAERSFSCLRQLKTYLISTMGQARLSSLGILAIEREFANNVDIEKVINVFGRRSGRN